jgi:hypothetical protein
MDRDSSWEAPFASPPERYRSTRHGPALVSGGPLTIQDERPTDVDRPDLVHRPPAAAAPRLLRDLFVVSLESIEAPAG